MKPLTAREVEEYLSAAGYVRRRDLGHHLGWIRGRAEGIPARAEGGAAQNKGGGEE